MDATPNHEAKPNLVRRVHLGWLRIRYWDPVQRAAQHHIHDDLAHVDARVAAFTAEAAGVRRQALMELERRVESLGPGRAAPAWTSLVQAAVAAVTILGALMLAIFNGWFGAVIKMTDEETGELRGITQEQFATTVSAVHTPIIVSVGALLIVVIWTLIGASTKDFRRGVARAWLRLFSELNQSLDEVPPVQREGIWQWARRASK